MLPCYLSDTNYLRLEKLTMSEESKELSDLHITTPIVLDEKMSELVLYLYTLCVVSRGMDENTVVDCKTADDVL